MTGDGGTSRSVPSKYAHRCSEPDRVRPPTMRNQPKRSDGCFGFCALSVGSDAADCKAGLRGFFCTSIPRFHDQSRDGIGQRKSRRRFQVAFGFDPYPLARMGYCVTGVWQESVLGDGGGRPAGPLSRLHRRLAMGIPWRRSGTLAIPPAMRFPRFVEMTADSDI